MKFFRWLIHFWVEELLCEKCYRHDWKMSGKYAQTTFTCKCGHSFLGWSNQDYTRKRHI